MWVNLGLYVTEVQSAVNGTMSADVVTTGWTTNFNFGPAYPTSAKRVIKPTDKHQTSPSGHLTAS
jgi:hypothetical protein